MINERYYHKSVAVGHKFFVVGGMFINDCEVFDSTTNNFTLLKEPILASGFDLHDPSEVITIGSKIFVFLTNSNVKTYDISHNEWSGKTCDATENIEFLSLVKYF